jgi:hypothetical protein
MTLNFTPGAKLLEEATYTATLTTAAVGLDGNALDEQETIQFTTWEELFGYANGEGCVPGAGAAAGECVLLALACLCVCARRRAMERRCAGRGTSGASE